MDKNFFFPDNLDVQNKNIILRLDLNVPLKDKIIKDYTRIDLCLPFIKRLVEKKAKIIIISHLGRPKENKDPALSLIPIYKYLKKILKNKILGITCHNSKTLAKKPYKLMYIFSWEILMMKLKINFLT